MTLLFALCTSAVTILGDAAVMSHERRAAEDRIAETLRVAIERAGAETLEYERGEEPRLLDEKPRTRKSLLEVARLDQAELAAGGLVLFVTDARDQLLWRSRKIEFPVSPQQWRTRAMWYGNQRLVVASSWKPVGDELQETAMALAGLGTVLVILSASGAWFLVGRTLSPIDALTVQARSASVDGLSVQLQAPSPDVEMERLATTLNTLLESLERQARLRGRFYLAASHELRTPLQALLGSLDVALSRPRAAQDYEKALTEAQMQTERLMRLVQDLLQLNAIEMRTSSPPPTRVNLADRIERTLIHLTALAEQRDIHLDAALPDVEIEAPPSHLEILLRNLIENALKYATPGSTVEIRLLTTHTHARLRVFNPCEVQPGSTASWFEPFFRPDTSRNSQTGGNGLGLATAAAREHAWTLDVRPQTGGVVSTVEWSLPPLSVLHQPRDESVFPDAPPLPGGPTYSAADAARSSTPR